jgi:hypothetical protein
MSKSSAKSWNNIGKPLEILVTSWKNMGDHGKKL